MLGAVREESVVLVGLDGESFECEADELLEEESYIDSVHGGFLDPPFVCEVCLKIAGWLPRGASVLSHSDCWVWLSQSDRDEMVWTQNKGDERSPDFRCWLVTKKKRATTQRWRARDSSRPLLLSKRSSS